MALHACYIWQQKPLHSKIWGNDKPRSWTSVKTKQNKLWAQSARALSKDPIWKQFKAEFLLKEYVNCYS